MAYGAILGQQPPQQQLDAQDVNYNGIATGTNVKEALDSLKSVDDGLQETIDTLTSTVSGKAQIVTGSYVGTGTSGSSNPNSLTFDSNPSFLIVYLSGIAIGNGYFFNCFFWVPGTSSIEINGSGSTYTARFSQSGNQISWYANNAGPQLNQSGTTYNYIAIL